jgi:hypothetical protein
MSLIQLAGCKGLTKLVFINEYVSFHTEGYNFSSTFVKFNVASVFQP